MVTGRIVNDVILKRDSMAKGVRSARRERDVRVAEKFSFRVPEVALLLSISDRSVYELMESKALGFVKQGNMTMITRRQVDDYLTGKELEAGWIPKYPDVRRR